MSGMSFDRILITGATGYVGSRLVRRLLRDGFIVHAVLREGSDIHKLPECSAEFHVHEYDGTCDGIYNVVRVARPDVVFHLASIYRTIHQPEEIEDIVGSNILFGTQLVEALVRCHVRNFVNVGTSWQHFNGESYNPANLYAATKQAYLDILRYYVESFSLRVVSLELFDTFGPDDFRPKLFNALKEAACSGEPIDMSPGEQLIDIVHIDDVLDAFILTLERFKDPGSSCLEVYGVGSGQPVKLRDLVDMYRQYIDGSVKVNWGAKPYRSREVMVPWGDFLTVPGWQPVKTLELLNGIKEA